MYRVFLTNHDYFYDVLFTTFQNALAWLKEKGCFEASIWHDEELVATWSPINGTTLLNQKRRTK